jgi:AAA+ ATPase superfamily predicted ATPase
MDVTGRKQEVGMLLEAFNSNRSELISVSGRRRIGKTFLIRNTFNKNIVFDISGILNISLKQQLENFHFILQEKGQENKKPKSWIEAFHQLGQYIDSLKSKKRKVIFIDEFPWFDSRKSKFLPAFENFWNSYAAKRNDLVVVICGSAAAYMAKKIIRNKGGLHNRLTYNIRLEPFNLNEAEQLLKRNKVKLTRYDVLMLYMVMGGVPYYLEKIKPGESVQQAIDRLCFRKDGLLRQEFKNVFASLFERHEAHEKVIQTLASVRKGMTRTEIVYKSKLNSGGSLTRTLNELEESGFIEKYTPYKGRKDSLFRLLDEYSMFYLRFIENTKPSASGIWKKLYNQAFFKSWAGFTFETVCIKHIEQIKAGLKISGIYSETGSWIDKNPDNGAQIDLLIDRADNVINLCEMKFYNAEFTIDKKYATELRNKVSVFSNSTKTKKNIFLTFITSYGLKTNEYSLELVQNNLTIDDLFVLV